MRTKLPKDHKTTAVTTESNRRHSVQLPLTVQFKPNGSSHRTLATTIPRSLGKDRCPLVLCPVYAMDPDPCRQLMFSRNKSGQGVRGADDRPRDDASVEPLTHFPPFPPAPTGGKAITLLGFVSLNGHPRGSRRYCRREYLFLANHAALGRPARQPFEPFNKFPLRCQTLGSAYLQLSIHGCSRLRCDQCSAPVFGLLDALQVHIDRT